jgi:hypothetical protein
MKRMIFAAALCAATAVAAPAAFADRWQAPINGNVSAVMMPDGDVMMKVQMPAAEFTAMDTAMKAGHKTCMIEHIYPDAWNTMILVCSRN